MTNTTTDWDLEDLDEVNFEEFALWVEQQSRQADSRLRKVLNFQPRPRRYNVRDRLGRFVKQVSVVQLRLEGGFVNASDGITHGHEHCGGLKGVTWTVDSEADGWLCSACVKIEVSVHLASRDVACATGHSTCDTCHTEKRIRQFPTVVVSGFRGRGVTCRGCEQERRNVAA